MLKKMLVLFLPVLLWGMVAQAQTTKLRERLGSTVFAREEGAYIDLTLDERLHFMSGAKHIINNTANPFQILEVELLEEERVPPEGTALLYRSILEKVALIREEVLGIDQAGCTVLPITGGDLAQRLIRARALAFELEGLTERLGDAVFSGITAQMLREKAILLSNFFELSLRVFEKRPPEAFSIDTFSNLWAIDRLARSKETFFNFEQGKFVLENPLYLNYLFQTRGDFLARFSLLAFLADYEERARTSGPLAAREMTVFNDHVGIDLPYDLGFLPWESQKRLGGGMAVFLARIYLERHYPALVRHTAGNLYIEFRLPEGLPIDFIRSELEAVDEPATLASAVREMQERLPQEEVLMARATELLLERFSSDLYERFPSLRDLYPPAFAAAITEHAGSYVLAREKVATWMQELRCQREGVWDRAVIIEGLKRCFREVKRAR